MFSSQMIFILTQLNFNFRCHFLYTRICWLDACVYSVFIPPYFLNINFI